MNVSAVVVALGAVLVVAPAYAQAPAPAQPAKPAPSAPAPQSKTPAAAEKPAPQLPPPFQDGFKYAYVRMQLIAERSADGKRATGEINALREKLTKELNDKNKELQTAQQTLETQGAVLSDAKRTQLQTQIERTQRDIQRMAEDADEDIARLQERLQQEFMKKLNPLLDRIAKEKQLHMIFQVPEAGLVWAVQGMDLTTDLIQALDAGDGAKPAASAPATTPPPAAPPAATPSPDTTK
jgi:Skp family chaperone for outer membrane proteins